MRKRDFPPRAIEILGGILKIKNKDEYFKYISEVRQEDRYKVLSIMVFRLNLVCLLKMV